MKHILCTALFAAGFAQAYANDYDKPYYLPGEGMYYVGLQPSTLKAAVNEPTLVTQAYQSRIRLFNTDVASIKAGTKTYNLADRISADGTELDLVSFMGVGNAFDLTLRNFDGDAYQLGDNAPEGSKKWFNTRLLAAQPDWRGHHTLPLAMYDLWDCPITYDRDAALGTEGFDAVRVDFGNPHEGLVITGVNFPLVCAPDYDESAEITVTLNVYNADRTEIIEDYTGIVRIGRVPAVSTLDDGTTIRAISIPFSGQNVSVATPFEVVVSGFSGDDLNVWLPRSVDATGIYPCHTIYDDWFGPEGVAPAFELSNQNAVVNVEGYFNYLGTWGWWDGKYERGEVVSTADLVQIYYDPADADWPGDYFMGEVGFPIECTFGADDITIYDMPDWINKISYDVSQWEEYGCVQLTMSADALPSDLNGRNGKVVLCTRDRASFYTIYIRQGAAWFNMDDTEGIAPISPDRQSEAATMTFDLSGRAISAPRKGQPIISGGKVRLY